jgi:hypothetical protein
MTNAASNVTVGFPTILSLLVTIIAMSISWTQVGGSLSCICLTRCKFPWLSSGW